MSSGFTDKYIVMAYRYGDVSDYHYPVGVFSTYEDAWVATDRHRQDNNFDYSHIIYKVSQDIIYNDHEAEIVYDTTIGLI